MAMQRGGSGTGRSPYRDLFDRLVDERGWRESSESRLPLDISATEDAITIEAALPGVPPEDVEVTFHQGTVTISVKEGSRESGAEETEVETIHREVHRSRGSRTITLPSGLDPERAEATIENGMLRLVLPRSEQAKPRQIQINRR